MFAAARDRIARLDRRRYVLTRSVAQIHVDDHTAALPDAPGVRRLDVPRQLVAAGKNPDREPTVHGPLRRRQRRPDQNCRSAYCERRDQYPPHPMTPSSFNPSTISRRYRDLLEPTRA